MRLALAAVLIVISSLAHAKGFVPSSARLRATMPPAPAKSPWTHSMTYSFASDYNDQRKPRAYNHAIGGSIGYDINPNWSLSAEMGLRYEMVDGQIPKEEQQTYSETLNPSTEFGVAYGEENAFRSYGLAVHAEPLWTEDARREGHQGLVGAGGMVRINFFNKRYTMTHALDGTSLINSFHYGTDKKANPDYFWMYKWRNDLKFARTWKLSYSFGAKLTRFLDGFIGYSYNNTTSISNTWKNLTTALSYDNGGFTDDGYVRMWYIDEYRRIARLTMSYSF
jgi:hypothetical protein